MSYGEFDPDKYKQEAILKLETLSKMCDLANAKKCGLHMDGMAASPDRPLDLPKPVDPGTEMVSMLRFLGRLRKAVGAFFDHLPTD